MKKRNIIAIIILVTILVVTTCHLSDPDGLSGFFLSKLYPEDTIYAQKFTEYGFRKIKIGMTKEEVVKIIGEPLVKYSDQVISSEKTLQNEIWKYSASPNDTNYRIRQIFFVEYIVQDKYHEFYLD